jgi:drug/metabolite transporter (DMT)-like permease
MMALGLALGAAVAWGGSDFLAGLASRRLPVLDVLAVSQLAGLVILLVPLAAASGPAPGPDAVLPACAAGVAELVGFAALYRALAVGPMSVVAPLSSLAAAVPVTAGLLAGERPGTGVAVGLALALAGGAVVAVEGDEGHAEGRRVAPGAALALAAALAFGTFFTAMHAAAQAGGVAWAVALNRATSMVLIGLVLVAARRGPSWRAPDLRAAGVAGILDAGANALFALALTEGLASTVSVIGSLYPVTTVLLAAVVLRERPRSIQALGIVAVLAGVGLVSAWGGA